MIWWRESQPNDNDAGPPLSILTKQMNKSKALCMDASHLIPASSSSFTASKCEGQATMASAGRQDTKHHPHRWIHNPQLTPTRDAPWKLPCRVSRKGRKFSVKSICYSLKGKISFWLFPGCYDATSVLVLAILSMDFSLPVLPRSWLREPGEPAMVLPPKWWKPRSINVSQTSLCFSRETCLHTNRNMTIQKIALLLGTRGTLCDMKLFRPARLSQRLCLDGPTWLNQCHACHSCLICDASKAPDL